MTKRQLRKRHATALSRVQRETTILERARDRKAYWSKVLIKTKQRLQLANEGQLEMDV